MSNGSKASSGNHAFAYVTTLFFAWGFVTSIIDPLIPSVKSIFTLSYAESMLTQFAWFIAYGVVSLPAAAILARLGFTNSIVLALATMVAGCLIIPLATSLDLYPGVLLALFVIASGVTLLQVAANPLVAALGAPERSHFRLTFSQAFNSLGTVLGPNLGALVMLSGGVFGAGALADVAASRAASLRNIDTAFVFIAVFFAALGVFIWLVRKSINAAAPAADAQFTAPWRAFKSPWALFGALAIFCYVGAEVAVGSLMINFLVQIDFVDFLRGAGVIDFFSRIGIMHAGEDERIAGQVLGIFYWGGAMVGRFVGSWLLTRVSAGLVLSAAAFATAGLCLVVTQSSGALPGIAALSIGFFNSIMFPTIFTLTLERSSAPPPATSGLLCMAIVGGAGIPYLAGLVADAGDLSAAFFVPMAAYVGVFAFATATTRQRAVAANG